MTAVIPARARRTDAAGMGYQRLSAQDGSFLHFESRATPMHVAAVALFDAGPLAKPGGGIDFERVSAHLEARLAQVPRYRSRLAHTPLGQPIWVDDARFSREWHVRRAALPAPGSEAALAELVGRVLSERLERSRPLWEMWLVEGLADGRFALVSKLHHCLVDGVGGANLLTLLMSLDPEEREAPGAGWRPAPEPGALSLAVDELGRGLAGTRDLVRAAGAALRDPAGALAQLASAGAAVADAIGAAVRWPAPTVLNGPIGPHRRVAWLALDLAAVKAVKRRLGGTVNDVVLAVVAGGLHRYFGAHAPWPTRLDYRVVVPVNMRPPGDFAAANRVSAHFLSLPVAEADALTRYQRVRTASEQAKRSAAARGIDLLTGLADRIAAPWLTQFGVKLASDLHPYHLIVTNVPGPPAPLYLLGAPLLALYPHLPLFAHQGLGVAAMSYGGRIGLGLIADYERVPELTGLRDAFAAAFAELEQMSLRAAPGAAAPRAAGAGSSPAPPRRARRRAKPPASRSS